METLNLKKVWKLLNRISEAQDKLDEKGEYLNLLGHRSKYSGEMSFISFLNYYSFKVEGDNLEIFNFDAIPWEDYCKDDLSEIPLSLRIGRKKLKSGLRRKWKRKEKEFREIMKMRGREMS